MELSHICGAFFVCDSFIPLLFLFPYLKLHLRRWGMSCIFAISISIQTGGFSLIYSTYQAPAFVFSFV